VAGLRVVSNMLAFRLEGFGEGFRLTLLLQWLLFCEIAR
jgi:hypothetical protein